MAGDENGMRDEEGENDSEYGSQTYVEAVHRSELGSADDNARRLEDPPTPASCFGSLGSVEDNGESEYQRHEKVRCTKRKTYFAGSKPQSQRQIFDICQLRRRSISHPACLWLF